MLFYIILFVSIYITLSVVTVYGIIERWYWLLIAALIFVNVFIICFVLHLAYCAFISVFVDIKKPIRKQNRHFYYLLVQTAYLVLRILRVRVHFSGKEFLPENSKFLLVCNHISWLDPAVAIILFKNTTLLSSAKKKISIILWRALFCMNPPVLQSTGKTTAKPLKQSIMRWIF